MSAAVLHAQVLAYVRAQFTKAEVVDVRPYAGEFSSEEVGNVSYTCPAIFITVLGWKRAAQHGRLTGRHAVDVRLAAFVVFKAMDRDKRMEGAMKLAEKLCVVLRRWRPDSTDSPVSIAGLDDEPTAENLYSRAMDAKGQALWLVDWRQAVVPAVPVEQLYDLVAVEITDHTRVPGPAAPGPAPAPLTVTEDVQFPPQP